MLENNFLKECLAWCVWKRLLINTKGYDRVRGTKNLFHIYIYIYIGLLAGFRRMLSCKLNSMHTHVHALIIISNRPLELIFLPYNMFKSKHHFYIYRRLVGRYIHKLKE